MYKMVLNRMLVPRTGYLIIHVKGREGDLELVPKEQNELFSLLPKCCYNDGEYWNLVCVTLYLHWIYFNHQIDPYICPSQLNKCWDRTFKALCTSLLLITLNPLHSVLFLSWGQAHWAAPVLQSPLISLLWSLVSNLFPVGLEATLPVLFLCHCHW